MFNFFDPVTLVIIVMTVIISLRGFSNRDFFTRYMFNTNAILKGRQYDRLLSSGFLHADHIHLFFNMITFYFFAKVVISFFANPSLAVMGYIDTAGSRNLGSFMMLFVYILSILGGNLFSLFFHKDEPNYNAIGASGGVSGILFSAIAIYPEMELYLFFALPIKAWIFGIIYLGYSVYAMKTQLGNIGHAAHLGGAVVGLLATIIYYPTLVEINTYYILGMFVPIAVLGYLAYQNK